MTDIAKLGFEVNSDPLAEAKRRLGELVPATDSAERKVDEFNRAANRTPGAAQRFVQSVTNMTNRVKGALSSTVGQIAAGFAAGFTAQAIISKLTATASALDDVSKAARAVGSAVPQMQALSVAGDLAGVGVDALSAATRRMNRVLGAAIAAGKGTQGVFARLGISAQELSALPIDERFAKIADRMKELGFSTADVTATLAALGDRGGSLIGLLGEGGDQIRKAATDVKTFNLAITDLQGANIEDMNDNFSRLGYAVQGAFNQLVATAAPVLSAIFLGIANGIAFVVANMGQLQTILTATLPVMAVMFGPGVIASVWAFAAAVATGAVGAVTALTAAIAANPLGALAIAITAIISLAWAFRDDIAKIFGIDLNKLVADGSNWIMRSFGKAFATVTTVWNNFPAIMGSAVVGAVNAMIDGINQMISAAVAGVNNLINSIPEQIRFGMGPISSASGQIGHMGNPFADQSAAADAALKQQIQMIDQTDYVGQLADAFKGLSTATDTAKGSTDALGTASTGLGTALDGLGDGSGSGATGKAAKGMKGLSQATQDALQKIQQVRDEVKGAITDAFKSFFSDIMHGKSAIDALKNSLGNLADKLMSMVLDQSMNAIVGSMFGALGGNGMISAGSAWKGGWGSAGLTPHMANGGAWYQGHQFFATGGVVTGRTSFNHAGGTGVMGEAGPEAILPLKRGAGGRLGVVASANDNGGVILLQPIIQNNASDQTEVTTGMTDDGQLLVMIDKISARNIADPSSRTNKAIRGSFGTANATRKR